MTKEMIISANVHEKKVAIIEDGVVTEFYVERSDENQGVVGNLYKGRVMKVLPGMQSAFVDIGLERDAFLYVSDFMELEDSDEVRRRCRTGEVLPGALFHRNHAADRASPHGWRHRARARDRRSAVRAWFRPAWQRQAHRRGITRLVRTLQRRLRTLAQRPGRSGRH